MAAREGWRSALITVAVAATVGAGGSAVAVRDGVSANAGRIDKVEAVQAERYAAILTRLDELRADIRTIKERTP